MKTKPCKIWNGEVRRSRNVREMSVHGVIWNRKTKKERAFWNGKAINRFFRIGVSWSKNKDVLFRKKIRDEHSGTSGKHSGTFLRIFSFGGMCQPPKIVTYKHTWKRAETNSNANRLRKLPKLSECGCEQQLIGGGWEGVLRMTMMCDRRGKLYSVHATV